MTVAGFIQILVPITVVEMMVAIGAAFGVSSGTASI